MLGAFTRADIAVPDEVSIVGYDDDRLSRLPHVNLTTVGQNVPRIGQLAVDTAVARLDGKDAGDREIVIAPHLVVRGTTVRPR